MTRHNHLTTTTTILAVLLAVLLLAPVARAEEPQANAFPGTPGAIAFSSNRDDFNANAIYRMNADGFGQTRLTDLPGRNIQPSWSADGAEITYVSGQNDDYEIHKMRADGGNETPLTADSAFDFAPVWGRGAKIVFGSTRSHPSGDIFLMTLGASGEPVEVKKLTTYTGQDGDPAVSPDGKRLAFSSYRDGDYDIYVMKLAPEGPTNRPVKITNSVKGEGSPEWSPDGRQLAFHGGTANDLAEVFRIKAAPESRDNRRVNLSNNPSTDYNPTWSPDGKKIAFQSQRTGNYDIFRIRATDGANPTNLTNHPAHDEQPSWQPIP